MATVPADNSGLGGAETTLTHAVDAGQSFGKIHFSTRKIKPPTVTLYNPSAFTPGTIRDLTANADVAATTEHIGETGFHLKTAAVVAAPQSALAVHWTADSRI
jgi:hypothetical protein